jgi:hypothetical protein
MKKLAILFSLVFIVQIAFAQAQKRVFKPTWKVGEKKTITIVEEKLSYEGDSLKSSETNTIDGEITVTRMDNVCYYITIKYSNVVLQSFQRFYDKLGEEMTAYKTIELKYKVNKQTGKSDLINWKEANDYVLKSFDEVSRIIKAKAPDAEGMLDIVFTPIKDMFKSKESAEGFFAQELGCVLSPFGKNYSTTDTLVTEQATKNPFGNDSLSATTRSILSNINEANGTCDIISSSEMDLSQVVQMIKNMMTGMMKKMNPDDAKAKEALAELDNIKMEMTNIEVLSFNFKTSWTSICTQKTVVTVSMPGRNGKQYVNKTYTIK